MKFSFHHTVTTKRRGRVLEKKVHSYTQKITRLLKNNDYKHPESSLVIAGDTKYQNAITKALKPFKGVKHVVLVGIGGSSLGTEAVYHALAFKTSPTLMVLDQIEKDALIKLEEFIKGVSNPKDIALVVVSKSGTTTETMLNAVKVLEVCEKKYGKEFNSRTIFIGNADTPFLKIGKKKKVLCFTMPDIIGGRYSVFTAVGMVPLTLLGIDTQSLREGALALFEKKQMAHVEQSTVILTEAAEHGMHTVNFFTFSERLEQCGYWYRQLLAESIGKRMTTKGTSFAHQLLPVVTTSADLHSMAQLYLGGYKNMYTHFVDYDEKGPYHLLTAHWLIEHVPFLAGSEVLKVKEAIRKGVLQAYDDQKLPYRYTELPKCSAHEIGLLLSSCMCEVMCLAHTLNVNAFDQPSVEFYKKHTRAILDS